MDLIVSSLRFPVVVKPCTGGGSLGVHLATCAEELATAFKSQDYRFNRYLVEEWIEGTFVTCGLRGTNGTPLFLGLLSVEFPGMLYDYDAKHTKGICKCSTPSSVSRKTLEALKVLSERVYNVLGCHSAVRVDYICCEGHGPYILEANTVPGMSDMGNMPMIAASCGMSYDELIEQLLADAKNRENA